MQMQGTRQGFKSIFPVRIGLDHLVGAQIPTPQKMTNASKINAHLVKTIGYGGRRQYPILPLRVIFRCAHIIKNTPDGRLDHCADRKIEHQTLSLLAGRKSQLDVWNLYIAIFT